MKYCDIDVRDRVQWWVIFWRSMLVNLAMAVGVGLGIWTARMNSAIDGWSLFAITTALIVILGIPTEMMRYNRWKKAVEKSQIKIRFLPDEPIPPDLP